MSRESDAHEHVPEERAELFECHDGGSTEVEYLDVLTALVRVEKPHQILETGTWRGYGAGALAAGCLANGFGYVWSIDIDHSNLLLLQKDNLVGVCLLEANTLEWLKTTDLKFDMAFFDSDLKIRCRECQICCERGLLKSGALVAFHDTSTRRIRNGQPDPDTQDFWIQFNVLRHHYLESNVFHFPLSRGLTIARVR